MYVINECPSLTVSSYTLTEPTRADQRYIDLETGGFWVWDNSPVVNLDPDTTPYRTAGRVSFSGCPAAPSPSPAPSPTPSPAPAPSPAPSPAAPPLYYFNATRCHDNIPQIVFGGTTYYSVGTVVLSGGTTYCYTIQNEVGAQSYDDTITSSVDNCGNPGCYTPPPSPAPSPSPAPTPAPVNPPPSPAPTPAPVNPPPSPAPVPAPATPPVYYYNATRCHDSVNQIVYGGTNYFGTGTVVISGGTSYCYTIQNEVGAQSINDTVGASVDNCGNASCYVNPPSPAPSPSPAPTPAPVNPPPSPAPTPAPVNPPPSPSPTPTPTASCSIWTFTNSSPDTDNFVYYTDCNGNLTSAYVYNQTSPQYCVLDGTTPTPADIYITVTNEFIFC
jgi:hypothetical protein